MNYKIIAGGEGNIYNNEFMKNQIHHNFYGDTFSSKIKIINIQNIQGAVFNYSLLKKYVNLEKLTIVDTQITSIPSEIFELTELKFLSINTWLLLNRETYFNVKNIGSISKLVKLQVLHLAFDIVEFPVEILQLKNLVELVIKNNHNIEPHPKLLDIDNLIDIVINSKRVKYIEYKNKAYFSNYRENPQSELPTKIKSHITEVKINDYDFLNNLPVNITTIRLNRIRNDLNNLPFCLEKIIVKHEHKNLLVPAPNVKLPFGCLLEYIGFDQNLMHDIYHSM